MQMLPIAIRQRFNPFRNMSGARGVVVERALDADIATDDMLLEGLETALPAESNGPAERVVQVQDAIRRVMILWVVVASVLVIVA